LGGLPVRCRRAGTDEFRLDAVGGIDLDPRPEGATPGAPLLFMLRDPDGNVVTVVQT
jgi:hypothetical protein